jgi:hypothetical protein
VAKGNYVTTAVFNTKIAELQTLINNLPTTPVNRITSGNNYTAMWKILNLGYTTNDVYITRNTSAGWYIYEFLDSVIVKKVIFNTDIIQPITISGSNNGVNYTTLYTGTNPARSLVPITLTSTGNYKFYKIVMTGSDSYIWGLNFLGDGVSIDTTSITAGIIPSGVYLMPDLKINNNNLAMVPERLVFDGVFPTISAVCDYDDITLVPTRTITTDITFKNTYDALTELTGLVYEIELVTGNAVHTANVIPLNQVSIIGNNALDNSLAYIVFDGDISTSFSIDTDATGIVDISHIYKFDVPTIIYKLKSDYLLATEAPKKYTVSGSFDGVTYVQLLNISQYVSVDNLSLTKSFDIDKYDAYSYYKISITEGNISSKVTINNYTLLKEAEYNPDIL